MVKGIKAQKKPLSTKWYRLETWLASTPTTVVKDHVVKTVGEIGNTPILVVPSETDARELKFIADSFQRATKKRPLLFNAPVRLLRAVEITEDDAAELEPHVQVFDETEA